MSAPIPCAPSCPPVIQNTNIPGAQGLPGTNGTSGTNGVDGFTTLIAAFTIPAIGATNPASVANSSWMVVGQIVVLGQGLGAVLANPGPVTCQVTAIASSTAITLKAMGYPGDATGTVSSGAIVSPSAPAHSQGKVTYLFNGTVVFTPQSTSTLMLVECIGAGGSGGGCDGGANASAASGGGGGAYSAKWITGPLAASYACAIGAGGAAPAAGANAGNAGADTSFGGGTVLAKGGGAGGAGAAAGTGAGVIDGAVGGLSGSGAGDFTVGGGSGRVGIRFSGTVAIGGAGGAAAGGGGGNNTDVVAAGAGANGVNFGGGGSGAVSFGGSATAAGGGGAPGVIKVTEWA